MNHISVMDQNNKKSNTLKNQKTNSNSKLNSIAIIGMSGFFPESNSVLSFWENLSKQKSLIKTIPENHDPDESVRLKCGAFIDELRGFDAKLFHIAGKEARYMTPQQRLLLMSVWHLFEDACILPSSLKNKRVAVIVGKEINPYMEYLTTASISAFTCLGMAQTYLPNRISNYFNFKGPSYCVDTSCSSGLTALHQGKKMLRNNEVDYVIVAGVSLIYGHKWTRSFFSGSESMGLMTTNGEGTKPYQKEASGFTPSEGVISLLLKRSVEAMKDEDNIHAHVLGSDSTHVGGVGNIAFPDAKEQSKVIIGAYKDAMIPAETVTHIESHAASSILADSQEVRAFQIAHKQLIEKPESKMIPPCKISSPKPNIGHMHAASGLASIIRLVFSFKKGKKLGIKNFENLSEEINLNKDRFYITKETESWDRLIDKDKNEIPRRGSVHNSGGGGNNIHVVLEEHMTEERDETSYDDQEVYFLGLSCSEESQFLPYAQKIYSYLSSDSVCSLQQLEYHYLMSRKALNHRLVFRFKTIENLREKLSKYLKSNGKSGYYVNGNSKGDLSLNEIFLKNGKVVNFLNDLTDSNDKSFLFDLWAKGYDMPILKYYQSKALPKTSLPGYPFKLKPYWLDIYSNKRSSNLNETSNDEVEKLTENSNFLTHERSENLELKTFSNINKKDQESLYPSEETLKKIIDNQLISMVSEVLELEEKHISTDEELGDYGFNSLGLTELANLINETYMIHLVPTIFYSYPTVKQLSNFLTDEYPQQVSARHGLVKTKHDNTKEKKTNCKDGKSLSCLGCNNKKCISKKDNPKKKKNTIEKAEPIAIIGMSARLPGSPDINTFWDNIKLTKDLITEIPDDRWNWKDHYGDPKLHEDKTKAKWGGFISDIDKFDPLHFNISPKEAELMDPQHRLALEEVYHALEDAGINPRKLQGSNTGVFIGSYFDDYATLVDRNKLTDSQIITGLSQSMLTNRISYLLDLRGPSETIDTACSSSLVAIHRGIENMRNGHCDMVIAGGVSLVLIPDLLFPLSQAGFLSEDGRCKTFDQAANGYVRGEGVGAIVMKPLSKAEDDGDRIYAVIRSSSENHGGKANTLTSPNPNAQKELLLKAYREANIDPRSVGYIEAHGTGTPLGDPIEVEGLKLAFKELYKGHNLEIPLEPHIRLGSVKANIGHLEPAAGVAGIIKVALCLKYKTIPGNPHLNNPNEYLLLEQSPFQLQKETTTWDTNRGLPRVAGISSFGAGGSNAHIVLEEYENESFAPTKLVPPYVVPLSARNRRRLKKLVIDLVEYLDSTEAINLADLSYTLQVGREPMEERLVILATDYVELRKQLKQFDEGRQEYLFTGNTRRKKANTDNETLNSLFTKESDRSKKLSSLAKLWVEGIEIDWERLYTKGERPNKISLPTYPFARDRYWLPEKKQISNETRSITSTANEKSKIIDLYHCGWKEIEIKQGTTPKGATLVLNSEGNEEIVNHLSEFFNKIIVVRDESIDRISYQSVTVVIDLGSKSKTDFHWVKAIQKTISQSEAKTIRFIHLKRTGETVIGQSLYQSLTAEYGRVSGICVELNVNLTPQSVAELIKEVSSSHTEYFRVKRVGDRWEACYLKELENKMASDVIRGPVLITGGTRGLGMACAKHLASDHKVNKLILMGREQLPPRKDWEVFKTKQGVLGEKIRNITYLESTGTEVRILNTSLSDKEALSTALDVIKEDWGPIKGLLHAAGIVDMETPAFINKSLDIVQSINQPKVLGLENLYQILNEHELEFGILFSSISALAPRLGAGQCDYAMANGYLDSFAEAHYEKGYRSVQWPSWKETGMGEVTSGIYVDMGLRSLTNQEGTELLIKIINLSKHKDLATISPLVYESGIFDVKELLKVPNIKRKNEVEITKTASNNVSDWVINQISEALRLAVSEIELDVPFQEYGVDSILLADLVKQFEKAIGGISLSPSIILEHPTVGMLGTYLLENHSEAMKTVLNEKEEIQKKSAKTQDVKKNEQNNHVITHEYLDAENKLFEPEIGYKSLKDKSGEPIAVVGIGCHFPDAENVGVFWKNLKNGKDSIREVPISRWDINKHFSQEKTPGKSYSKWGAFIDDIENFDPGYFGIPKELASQIDPLERQWLEVSAEAIADAGYDKKYLSGKSIGVFAGARVGNFRQKLKELHKDFIVGTGQNFITAHLAHIYNLKGPNMVIDTACSSSLTAIDLAVRSLRRGETDLSFAGGVDILLDEGHFVGLSTAEVLSPDGKTKTFDESADGTGLGEGCGVLLLKRLGDAITSGDKIYGVIEGTAVNNDGSTMGITTPNPKAQQELIEAAIQDGNINRNTISYIEAHGTGTLIGDPIELKGITAVLSRENKNTKGVCGVGSVKTNIGHLMSAAGVAGVIKTLLSISAGQLPPTLNCQTPNPRFDFSNAPVYPIRELQKWNGIDGIRRAGVSAFGLGGNNAHIIMSNDGIPQENRVAPPFSTSNISFDKKRYWPEHEEVTAKEKILVSKEMQAYFKMEEKLEGTDWVFEIDIFNSNYILRDHRVHNVSIIPGVTYLDLILRASKKLFNETFDIRRIVFSEPLATDKNNNRLLQLRFRKGTHSPYEAMIRSIKKDSAGKPYGNWNRHLHCRMYPSQTINRDSLNIKNFIDTSENTINMHDVYSSARSVEIVHGEFMQTQGLVYQKGKEELMKLCLSDLSEGYRNKFLLHPAFLDGATFSGSSFHAIEKNQVSYIPFSIEEFLVFNSLPSEIYVYSNQGQQNYDKPSEVIKSNIDIYDKEGNLLVRFKNLAIKRIRHAGLIHNLLQNGVNETSSILTNDKPAILEQEIL